MSTSIIPLLAERLDISEDQARSLLDTMVEELRQRAESDGVQLSGLGTFQKEGGTLTFQPSPTLRQRVNRPYEGLTAESLSPSPAGETKDSPARSAPGPTDPPDSTEPEPPPFLTPKSAPEEDPNEEAMDSESSPTPAAEGEESSTQDRRTAHTDGRSPDSFTIISLVLTVIFLLGVGWFVLDRTNLWNPDQDSPPTTATEDPPAQAGETTAPDSDTGAQSDAPSDSGAEPPTDQEEPSTARDWTIVVASRSSRSVAQEVADAYASRFDSVTVVPGTVDNTTWYRVTIGRYASEANAERVLDDRADALPSDAWTHNLE